MSGFRLVQFTCPQDFLHAVQAYDEGFMNFPIGVLLDSMNEIQITARKLKNTPRMLLAIYAGEAIV